MLLKINLINLFWRILILNIPLYGMMIVKTLRYKDIPRNKQKSGRL